MQEPSVEIDQRDLPPAWHLKAVLAAAVILALVLSLAIKTFLN
jgi:hypothetical protein